MAEPKILTEIGTAPKQVTADKRVEKSIQKAKGPFPFTSTSSITKWLPGIIGTSRTGVPSSTATLS